jgi:hypothetical protein
MERFEPTCAGRRDALKLGLQAGIVIAIVATAGRAFSQGVKLSKDAVKYSDTGNVAGKDCDDCNQYVPGKSANEAPTCKIVEGPINAHGHCIAFSPK